VKKERTESACAMGCMILSVHSCHSEVAIRPNSDAFRQVFSLPLRIVSLLSNDVRLVRALNQK